MPPQIHIQVVDVHPLAILFVMSAKASSSKHASSSSDAKETKKRKEKKTKPAETVEESGIPSDIEIEYGEFDYDAIKNDPDVELWLVRVPKKARLPPFSFASLY